MQARWTKIIALALAAMALGWALHLRMPIAERTKPTDASGTPGEAKANRDASSYSPAPARADAQARASESAGPVDAHERARFNERAREFFAQAPALSPEEARQRAADLSQELSRIEQVGGLSAGETFLLRAGLIRATVADEQQQVTQLRALKERYEVDARQRNALAAAQSDPMFQLYKVRESQIVAETLSLQTIPNGLSRDEYLRRRLQAEREQLLGEAM
ncbi:hypothetical protein [Steroidobacter cummioxidans]|uniref:hypothetical protein n=1 Tax=Steroidobacter cummioxidans TaxID=1803913 RepID=UPI000E321007|nr:hypothetical protein [Steroidobacter cummioxidans]